MFNRCCKIGLACAVFGVLVAPSIAAAGDKKIVHLELKGPISEAPPDMMFTFGSTKNIASYNFDASCIN